MGQSPTWIYWQNLGEGELEDGDSTSQIAATCGFSSCRGLFFFTHLPLCNSLGRTPDALLPTLKG